MSFIHSILGANNIFKLNVSLSFVFIAGVGHDVESPPPSSHSAHSSLLQHVLLLEQARQQTAMLAGIHI